MSPKTPLSTHIPPDRATNPTVPYLHALAAMSEDRWDEAVASWQRFLVLEKDPPSRKQAYQNLAVCYENMQRYDDALAALDEVGRLSPGDPVNAFDRGVIYACAARIPQAIAAFEMAERHPPHRVGSRAALRKLRRIQQGKLSPGDFLVDHLQEQIRVNVAMGDFPLVEAKARRMIAVQPRRPEGHFALGVACLELGRPAEALEAFQNADRLDPGHAPTCYNIGHVLIQLDQPKAALPWLEKAVGNAGENLRALHEMGVACERLGRREDAIGHWKRALKKAPAYEPAQWRLHEIGEGPKPAPPTTPNQAQLRRLTPVVKARMRQPQVARCGGITLSFDGEVGFVLEDADNPLNATIHAGSPFQTADILDEDALDLLGLVKLSLCLNNASNTRDVALLVYYPDGSRYNYSAHYERGRRVSFGADGHLAATVLPRFFKLRMDSDLETPYGKPMQGKLIYVNQAPQPGVLISTMGLEGG